MDIDQLKAMAKREFNNAMCLIGIIPFLVFVYLLVNRASSFEVFVGSTGRILFASVIVLLLGIVLGRNILSTLLNKLIDFNQQIVKIQAELIEKSRLSAVTETVLALSHEINNPLMIIRGNLELLETGISQSGSIPVEDKDRFIRIKNNFERIMNVTNKMANLSKPVSRVVAGGINMIDLSKSE